MTTDGWMRVASGLRPAAIPLASGMGRFRVPGGSAWALGNRDRPLDVSPWVSRAVRARANLTENLAPFAILVPVAHVAGKANEATALGATLLFLGRVAHCLTDTAGRTITAPPSSSSRSRARS